MKLWQKVLREGIFPRFTDEQLRLVWEAAANDDPELVQGETVSERLDENVEWAIRGACFVGYAYWKGECLTDGNVVADRFHRLSEDLKLPGIFPEGSTYCTLDAFTLWFDGTDRPEALYHVVEEIDRELERRATARAVPADTEAEEAPTATVTKAMEPVAA